MHPKEFHSQIDKARLVAALADAERHTTGRIHIYVSHRAITDPLPAAQQRFHKLGLPHIHPHQPSVLIYLVPKTHQFAILGSKAIHERCGETYWQQIADALGRDLKAGDITGALLNAVSSLKRTLEEHFPSQGVRP